MSLILHRAERADVLVHALGEVLRQPLEDPFTTEIVSVPTRGVERWLAQQLSHRLGTSAAGADGICAGVTFPSPRRLVGAAVAAALGEESADPWQAQRLVWPLLEVIDAAREQPWARLLWSYLGDATTQPPDSPTDPVRGGRRWSTARRIAGLLAQYATDRPAMVRAWEAGRDVDDGGRVLLPDQAWQAELWRRLCCALPVPAPASRLDAALARIREDPDVVGLPARLSVFGATRLNADHQLVLDALARHREVHLWLPSPSPVLWATVDDHVREQGRSLGPRSQDATAQLAHHRLLGYLGRDSRELQVTLLARTTVDADLHHPRSPAATPPTLLRQLQADIAENRPPAPAERRPLLARADRSVQVHAAHGADRQVEVLREVLVGLLADEPDLEPRDIVVMCPDIERFAPLISAAFGLDSEETAAEHPGHRLRVRLADRSLRQLNPLLAVLARLLDLVDSRLSASSVLDFAAMPPVARRFGLGSEDLERLTQLAVQAGVRWGLDAEHRRRWQMADFAQNTWAAGLDRLLLGVAMDEEGEHFLGTALPLDDVDSSDVDLVGRLAELLARVRTALSALTPRQPLSAWISITKHALATLTAVGPPESWQLAAAYAELSRLGEEADADPELSLAELRSLLSEALRGRASRANFRTGTLTMCTLHPMRSIPHRVVCLLGMDDGVFPRRTRIDGDDILAVHPWVGDRDARSEDRQLLLDAILAADDHLVVIYAGADPRTGIERSPAVPIGELLDALDLTARTVDGRAVRDHITVRHPLQPFDPKNFVPNGLLPDGRFSFDRAALRGARAAMKPQPPSVSPYEVGVLPPPVLGDTVELADLVRFFRHPANALLRTRAGLLSLRELDESTDELPVVLDRLEGWAVGERLLRLHLRGADLDRLAAAEWRRGTLPPRLFGQRSLEPILDQVRHVAAIAQPYLAEPLESYDISVPLSDRLLTGTVSPVHGDYLLNVSYATLTARQRLNSWINLLALAAGRPEREWRAVTVGRGGVSTLGPVDGGWAGLVLTDLYDLYLTGLREPVPFMPRASAEYAQVRHRDRSVEVYRRPLEDQWRRDCDDTWQRLLGGSASLDQLMTAPSRSGEERGRLAEPTRFGTLARRVFHPMLSVEELG